MRGVYTRQFVIMAGLVLVSFFMLGIAFISLSYQYTIQERQELMENNAVYVAEVAGGTIVETITADGYTLRAALLQPLMEGVSRVTDTNTLIAVHSGEIIYASDNRGETFDPVIGKTLPETVIQRVQIEGSWSGFSDLQEILPTPSYVTAHPILIAVGGQPMMAGLVVVSTENDRITELWREFSSIFFPTAIGVLLIAFLASSISSKQMAKPLQTMAETVRRFGHGDHEARVMVSKPRHDEIGELAEAFNTMADSIAKSEAQRTEFIANVSHELKTPMTTIAGFAEGILDGTIPPERERDYLKTISSETRRLSRLVLRMLDLTRLQSEEETAPQEQFNASEILLRVLVSLESKINQRGLDVDTFLPEKPVMVWGDPDAITQVCYNLLDNAIKFSTPSSTLGVRIECRGAKAFVGICNEGATIPAHEVPLLFDRFHKLDRSRNHDKEGVGLGLYIVKTIINQHHEIIKCTSQEGVTDFVFTLTLV